MLVCGKAAGCAHRSFSIQTSNSLGIWCQKWWAVPRLPHYAESGQKRERLLTDFGPRLPEQTKNTWTRLPQWLPTQRLLVDKEWRKDTEEHQKVMRKSLMSLRSGASTELRMHDRQQARGPLDSTIVVTHWSSMFRIELGWLD